MFQDGSMKTISSASRIRRELIYNVHHSPKRRSVKTPNLAHFCPKTRPQRQAEPQPCGADCFYLTLVPRYHPLSLPQLGSRSSRKQAFSPRSPKRRWLTYTATEHPNNCPNHSGGFYHHKHYNFFSHQRLSITAKWFIILVFIAFLLTISSTF